MPPLPTLSHKDTVVMSRIGHRAEIELDGLVDSTWGFDADHHVRRHASTAPEVEITVQLTEVGDGPGSPQACHEDPSAGEPLTSEGEL